MAATLLQSVRPSACRRLQQLHDVMSFTPTRMDAAADMTQADERLPPPKRARPAQAAQVCPSVPKDCLLSAFSTQPSHRCDRLDAAPATCMQRPALADAVTAIALNFNTAAILRSHTGCWQRRRERYCQRCSISLEAICANEQKATSGSPALQSCAGCWRYRCGAVRGAVLHALPQLEVMFFLLVSIPI